MPALPMLPQWKQLHHNSPDLCVLFTSWSERCLCDANTRDGRAAEEGQVTLLIYLVEQMSEIIVNNILKAWGLFGNM